MGYIIPVQNILSLYIEDLIDEANVKYIDLSYLLFNDIPNMKINREYSYKLG